MNTRNNLAQHEDEVLKCMLKTPPKKHAPLGKKPKPSRPVQGKKAVARIARAFSK